MISTFEFSDYVVGILVNSDINDKVMDEIHAEILSKLEENETINLFVEIEKGHHVSLKTMLKDLIFKLDHAKQFNKIAMVTDLNWLATVMSMKDLIMTAEVRSFETEERLEAMNWISQ